MQLELTAATERALKEAACWSLEGSGTLLHAPAVLLGLLTEPECRAAIDLSAAGIDQATIVARWQGLRREREAQDAGLSASGECGSASTIPPFSPELTASVAAADEWLADLPRPLMLATEHMLLGLVAAEHEVARWLRERGLDPRSMCDAILRQYGVMALPVDPDDRGPAGIAEEGRTPSGLPPIEVAPGELSVFQEASQDSLADPNDDWSDPSVIRLFDAAANRGREALRVIEDYVRFVLDDRHLTERLKLLRHGLTEALASLPIEDRLSMRDTGSDVGTTVTTDAEMVRHDTEAVLTANFTRLQESLRSLEEFGKINAPHVAQTLERLRYESYTLHKAIHGTVRSADRLANMRLYVLIDGCETPARFEELAASLVDAGVDVLQLRDKNRNDRELLDRARRLRRITAETETLFVMNDRPDLASLAGADGVHVGQEELTVRDVRRIVGARMLVGVSTHDMDQARQAVLDGADYLGVGPTFPSPTKSFTDFPGLEFVRQVAEEIRLPAFAIGGINTGNVGEVVAAGIGRVAVSGAVVHAERPAEAVRAFCNALQAAAP